MCMPKFSLCSFNFFNDFLVLFCCLHPVLCHLHPPNNMVFQTVHSCPNITCISLPCTHLNTEMCAHVTVCGYVRELVTDVLLQLQQCPRG